MPDSLETREELGIVVGGAKKKLHIIELIRATDADDNELLDCWVLILEKRSKEVQKSEREETQWDRELEMKKLELEMRMLEAESLNRASVPPSDRAAEIFRMKDIMRLFKVGEDIGPFL